MHNDLQLQRVRLPQWLHAPACPDTRLSDITIRQGRIDAIHASAKVPSCAGASYDAGGALALPGLVDMHTHLDKAFTRGRTSQQGPGLLNAIAAMMQDRATWTEADIHARAAQGLQWAWAAGVTRLRSHCDWWEATKAPAAWAVLHELAETWQDRIRMDCVTLAPLSAFADAGAADAIARCVARRPGRACLGAFIHSSNWHPRALAHLLDAAERYDLALDVHIDEELHAQAQGLATLARMLRERGVTRPVVCGHACALAAQDEAVALQTLDAVAAAAIVMISLPSTNLLLQDAQPGRSPRQRGLTLVQEARQRGIPVLFASDNVEDPFSASGSFDPIDALHIGALAGQLATVFDAWSDSICRADWIDGGATPLAVGQPADLVLLPAASPHGFPSRCHPRTVIRAGRVLSPSHP